MKHQLVQFFTIFTLLTLLFGAVPAAPVSAEAHAVPLTVSGDFLWAKSVGGADQRSHRTCVRREYLHPILFFGKIMFSSRAGLELEPSGFQPSSKIILGS